jgi:hypothetical protein
LVAPLAAWLLSLIIAALVAPTEPWSAAPYVSLAISGTVIAFALHRNRRKQAFDEATRQTRNAFLPAALADLRDRQAPRDQPGSRELDERQLQHLRYLLDRALQPIEAFDGFDIIDQFQGAALRYQLNFSGYSLALAQCHYTPSFHGYLSQAQRNLIDKYMDYRVWSYWITETIGGHFNLTNFDPVGKDNIMLSGFFGIQVGLYTSSSGDRRYLEPGSLTFLNKDRSPAYPHDHGDINDANINNFKRSPFCLYPCEPNWIYAICNHMGMTSVALDDRLRGKTNLDEILPRWLDMLDSEMSDGKGSPLALRSTLTGWSLPFPTPDAMFVTFANCFIPDRARRLWAIAKTELTQHLSPVGEEQGPHLLLPGTVIDYGNYRKGQVWVMGQIANAAREMGDYAFADTVERTMDRDCGLEISEGVARYTQASNAANCYAILAKLQRRDDFRTAVCDGPPASTLTGPILEDAPYPDVLVAKAFSRGNDLELVLRPGRGGGIYQIKLARLKPGATYEITDDSGVPCDSITADGKGTAHYAVTLTDRLALHFTQLWPS